MIEAGLRREHGITRSQAKERQGLNAEDVFAGALRLGHRLHEVSFLRQGPKLKRSTALQSISIDFN